MEISWIPDFRSSHTVPVMELTDLLLPSLDDWRGFDTISTHLFRRPIDEEISEDLARLVKDEPEEKDPDCEEYVLCRQCRHILTTPAERINVQGAHRHTFINPQGFVYEIGCFRTVTGCGYAGPATKEWSWFVGYRWRIAVCNRCLGHLGWIYLSNGNSVFYGLILSRIIEP